MKILSETELSSSATSYRIEIDEEDLRTEESSEESFQRYLSELRKEARTSQNRREESQTPSSARP
jgi:hypothetical protein